MVTIGVVLLLVAGVLTADLVLENSGRTEVMIMGQSLSFDIWGLFVLGIATGVLLVAGVQLSLQGLARDRHRRKVERHRARELGAAPPAVQKPAVPEPPVAPAAETPGRSAPAAGSGVAPGEPPGKTARKPTAGGSSGHPGDRVVARVADLHRKRTAGSETGSAPTAGG